MGLCGPQIMMIIVMMITILLLLLLRLIIIIMHRQILNLLYCYILSFLLGWHFLSFPAWTFCRGPGGPEPPGLPEAARPGPAEPTRTRNWPESVIYNSGMHTIYSVTYIIMWNPLVVANKTCPVTKTLITANNTFFKTTKTINNIHIQQIQKQTINS